MPSVFTLEGPNLALLGPNPGAYAFVDWASSVGAAQPTPLRGDSEPSPSPLSLRLALALGAVGILGAAVGFGLCQRRRQHGLAATRGQALPGCSDLGRIKGLFADRLTPKRKAQEMILCQIHSLESDSDWAYYEEMDGMTQREVELVSDQITKQRDRIAKLFRYDPWA